MTEENKNKKKDELLKVLSDVKRDAHELVSKKREAVKEGRYAADLASCNEEYIRCIPDDTFLPANQWDNQISSWTRWRQNAGEAMVAFSSMQPLTFATDSSSVASSAAISSVYISHLPSPSQDQAKKVFQRYEHLIEQANPIQEMEVELSRLNLSSSKAGIESVFSLVQQAYESFKVPSVNEVAPSAVLIPVREAINRSLADLLRRRPAQEETKNQKEKIISICRQCARLGVTTEQIDQLANESTELNKLLSGAKQDVMSREQVRELMNRGLLFLRTFLRTIDENKLRNF